MTYRIRRKFTSSTFKVEGQICKIFLEPIKEYEPGYWFWNTGFAVGKSIRQLNDWYWKRKNKRVRRMQNKFTGKSGIKTIRAGFEEVLRLRWCIEPGDCIALDCTSGDPDRQFRAWSRWHKYHPEWIIDYENKEFLWHRPPYGDDPIRKDFNIVPLIPEDPLANTFRENYFECFRAYPKDPNAELTMEQISALLSPVLSS